MAINSAALTAAADGPGLGPAITHLSLHTAEPDASGSNETTATRQPATWAEDAGELTLSAVDFTGVAPSGPVTHVGLWGADTGGTFYGWLALVGDQTANAAGEYRVDSVTLTGTAS